MTLLYYLFKHLEESCFNLALWVWFPHAKSYISFSVATQLIETKDLLVCYKKDLSYVLDLYFELTG